MTDVKIRPMLANDWETVSKIYEEGIATGFAIFETSAPSYKDWNTAHMRTCRFVAEYKNKIIGWAALSPVSSRCVYGGVAEVSVYVSEESRGKSVATSLLKQLIVESEKANIWTLQSGIFPNNTGSIKLHEKAGFRHIGKKEKIGKLNGVWYDNILFERRSKIIGVE